MTIDYVIAWVDGNDPKHRQARRLFPPDDGASRHEDASGDVRFNESGEIYYNIASVLKYAPFIRRIFIVTDDQKPRHLDAFFREGLCDRSFISLVSHDKLFDGLGAARPNFNSLSIEAALWRIPGLSEHFVYANDDFFLNAPVSPEAFFVAGRPVLGGRWTKLERKRLKVKLRRALRKLTGRGPNTNPTYRKSLSLGAEIAGVMDGFMIHEHHPHPLRRSTFARFFEENMGILHRQVSFRYRNIDQFNPVSLANHLEISRHGVPIGPQKQVAYLTPRMGRRIVAQLERIRSESVPFGCIQSFEAFPAQVAGEMRRVWQRSSTKRCRARLSSRLMDRPCGSPQRTRLHLHPGHKRAGTEFNGPFSNQTGVGNDHRSARREHIPPLHSRVDNSLSSFQQLRTAGLCYRNGEGRGCREDDRPGPPEGNKSAENWNCRSGIPTFRTVRSAKHLKSGASDGARTRDLRRDRPAL